MGRKKTISILLIWALLAVILGSIGVIALDWRESRLLAKNGIETVGRVTAKEPDNHRFVRYSFQINDRWYSGTGNAGGVNHEFDQLKVGDAVKVFYDPDDPNKSFLGDPKGQLDSTTLGVMFFAFVGSSVAVFGLYNKGWFPFDDRLQ